MPQEAQVLFYLALYIGVSAYLVESPDQNQEYLESYQER